MSFHQAMQNIYRTLKTIRNKKEILLPFLSSKIDPKLSFSLFASINLSEKRKMRLINVYYVYHFVGFLMCITPTAAVAQAFSHTEHTEEFV